MSEPRHQPTTIVLVGMMGSGKTAIGRDIAARTGWRYMDNDELVTEAIVERILSMVGRS